MCTHRVFAQLFQKRQCLGEGLSRGYKKPRKKTRASEHWLRTQSSQKEDSVHSVAGKACFLSHPALGSACCARWTNSFNEEHLFHPLPINLKLKNNNNEGQENSSGSGYYLGFGACPVLPARGWTLRGLRPGGQGDSQAVCGFACRVWEQDVSFHCLAILTYSQLEMRGNRLYLFI